jgi:hypothetical protein
MDEDLEKRVIVTLGLPVVISVSFHDGDKTHKTDYPWHVNLRVIVWRM